MKSKTIRKLEKAGFDKEWLFDVQTYWIPKPSGKYKMTITDIDCLCMEPEDGIFIEETYFDNYYELSIIHNFFEGNAYVMIDTTTGKEVGRGIIDGAPFKECEEWENNGLRWDWIQAGIQ